VAVRDDRGATVAVPASHVVMRLAVAVVGGL